MGLGNKIIFYKRKTDKLDFIKISVKRMKTQTVDWERYLKMR